MKLLPSYELANEFDKIKNRLDEGFLINDFIIAEKILASWEALPEHERGSNILDETQSNKLKRFLENYDEETARRNQEHLYLPKKDEEVEKPALISAKTILDLDIPKQEWLVKNLFVKKGVNILAGDSGSLKSYTTLHLALSLIQKKTFLSYFDVSHEGTIVYIDEENRIITIKERLGNLTKDTREGLENLYYSIEAGLKLDDKTHIKILQEVLKEQNPSLIIFDSFIRFFSGDENSSKDVKKVFDTLKLLIKDFDCGIILLHHVTKNSGTTKHSLRGSGDLSAFADVVVMIEKKSPVYFDVKQVKNRHLEEFKPFRIQLMEKADNEFCIEFVQFLEEFQSKLDKCKEELQDWFIASKIKQFRTGQAVNALKSKGYTRNDVQDCITALNGVVIDKVKKGLYDVRIASLRGWVEEEDIEE